MSGRTVYGVRAIRAAIIVVLVARFGLAASDAHADAAEAKKIFTSRCMACHTFGKGVKVGPDLKGVNERRQRAWLLKFVRGSSQVIASGDPIATELFATFKQQRMPDWVDLSEDQVNSILDWLGINGPDQKQIDERLAETATTVEIENGRQLFHGEKPLANGGTACAACHSIRDDGKATGGSFAHDLTNTFTDFQDGEMAQFLRHPCFTREPESTNTAFLTPEENFYIKGYLRETAVAERGTAAESAPGDKKDDKAAAAGATVAKPVDPGPSTGGPPAAAGSAAPSTPAPGANKRVPWAITLTDLSLDRHPPHGRFAGALLFQVFPYISLLILIAGLVIRFIAARRRTAATDAASATAWKLFSGGPAWRTGLVITAALHLVGLLLPSQVLAWDGTPMKLYLLEGSGFLFGIVALIGWLAVMRHHIGKVVTHAHATEILDAILLSALGLAILSGLVTAVVYRWGSSWAEGTLAPYMTSLATGSPTTVLVEELPFLVRLHTVLWFAVLTLIPFTSAALVLVSAAHRILTQIGRPFEAMAAAGRRTAGKLSPARWLWPEEDAIELSKPDKAQEPS